MKANYNIRFCARCGHSEAMHIKCPNCGTIHCYRCFIDEHTKCAEFVLAEPPAPAKPDDAI